MNTVPFSALACPLDGEPLLREPSRWCCPQGHSFDIARQGYVNLLPAQFKRAKEPGDSKAMETARQHFLARGHYLRGSVVVLSPWLCYRLILWLFWIDRK